MSHETSVPLAIPRTGSQRLTNGGQTKECITFAAWQSPQDKTPKRVVVRVDGLVNNSRDEEGNYGFPCGVVLVTYTIGGLNKEVLLDCLTQSALVVWANTVEVTAHRDTARIAALAAFTGLKPCLDQTVAAAISACECGDTGFADARYLSVLPVDAEGQDQTFIVPIPNGARLVRFLSGADTNGVLVAWATGADVLFSANDPSKAGLNGVIEAQTVGPLAAFTIPADARFMQVTTAAAILYLATPAFIEWVIAPSSVTVQTP